MEIACGPSPHLSELARRGYEYIGLDINRAMLEYARAKGIRATFLLADMRKFEVVEPVDFIFTMLGSFYVETTDDGLSHFASVAKVLKSGGLYFLDWCIDFQWYEGCTGEQMWTIESGGVKADVKFANEGIVDRAA
jgi:SAM-dependent methyltransferase